MTELTYQEMSDLRLEGAAGAWLWIPTGETLLATDIDTCSGCQPVAEVLRDKPADSGHRYARRVG